MSPSRPGKAASAGAGAQASATPARPLVVADDRSHSAGYEFHTWTRSSRSRRPTRRRSRPGTASSSTASSQFRQDDRRRARGPQRRGDAHHPQPGDQCPTSGAASATRPSSCRAGRLRREGRDRCRRALHRDGRAEAEEAGTSNVSFEVGDVETTTFDEQFDYAFARFGTMFFANPVAAMRNVRAALVRAGGCHGRLAPEARQRVALQGRAGGRADRQEDPDSDEPTCGPGPFSMANADTTSGILVSAGFEDIAFGAATRVRFGGGLDDGVDMVMAIGPAGEVDPSGRRPGQAGGGPDPGRPSRGACEYVTDDGVRAQSSTWIVERKG